MVNTSVAVMNVFLVSFFPFMLLTGVVIIFVALLSTLVTFIVYAGREYEEKPLTLVTEHIKVAVLALVCVLIFNVYGRGFFFRDLTIESATKVESLGKVDTSAYINDDSIRIGEYEVTSCSPISVKQVRDAETRWIEKVECEYSRFPFKAEWTGYIVHEVKK